MELQHGDVGAWWLKGNPDEGWDYWAKRRDERLTVGKRDEGGWSLGNTYRNELIEPGDRIVLYMTGKTQAIVEIGRRDDEPLSEAAFDPKYVIDKSQLGKLKVMVSFDTVRLRTPIPKSQLRAISALSSAEFIRAPQMTNPSYLTHAEVAALEQRIPPAILREAGWR